MPVKTDDLCAAVGCSEKATDGPYSQQHSFMCPRHWEMVPNHLRGFMISAYNLAARGQFVRAQIDAVRAVRSCEHDQRHAEKAEKEAVNA